VDWYGCKKLAYHYIKRSQEPFTMLLKEPENNVAELVAVNDSRELLTVEYTVTNLIDDSLVDSGKFQIQPDGKEIINTLSYIDHAFLKIEWKTQLGKGINHHTCSIGDKWEFEKYIDCMKKIGFYNEFEGF
jgi:beta-mannosidase